MVRRLRDRRELSHGEQRKTIDQLVNSPGCDTILPSPREVLDSGPFVLKGVCLPYVNTFPAFANHFIN